MSDTIESPAFDRIETAVPDPNLFYLRELNRKFVAGQTARPQLSGYRPDTSGCWVVALVFGVGLLALNFLWPWSTSFLPPGQQEILMFLAFLFAVGVLVLVVDVVSARRGARLKPNKAQIGSENAKRPPERPTVQIIDGTVVQAEKIRTNGLPGSENIGVRYQFAAPGGVVTVGYAEGLAEDASSRMAPVPGTPVKVYYLGDGKHYLL